MPLVCAATRRMLQTRSLRLPALGFNFVRHGAITLDESQPHSLPAILQRLAVMGRFVEVDLSAESVRDLVRFF